MTCPATPAMKLTTTSIKALTLPEGARDKTFFDDELPGFGVRLRAGGSAKLIVQYDLGGKTRRVTLGAIALLDLGEARKRAREILAARALGRDPAAEKQDRARAFLESFGALLPRYLAFKRTELRPRSYRETERHLRQYAKPLHSRPVASIDRRAIAALLATLTEKNGAGAAKCARASLGGYFTWLLREGLVDTNPVAFTNKPAEHGARTRVLGDGELREIWWALEGAGQYADIVRLLVLTAARRAEIGDLSWDEINFDAAVIELPAIRMKGGHPHTIPLSGPALAILAARQPNGRLVFGRGRAGFVGWSSAKRTLDTRIAVNRKAAGIAEPMPAWVLHDLRRLASTRMHELGIAPPHVIERVLAHHQGGISAVYNRADYIAEKRRALARWAVFVEETVSGKQPAEKIIKLR
jgi:integrase